jgi:hypothetical protein
MTGPIIERLINVTFSIGTGTDGSGTPVVTKYEGLRISANIVEAGGYMAPTGQFTIYGLSPADMNKISSIGLYANRLKYNTITVEAGDATYGMTKVFSGVINEAYVDFEGAPDVGLQVTSLDGAIEALKPIAPTSYQGSAPVAAIMGYLAAQMGYTFENNGVTAVLSNPYFSGTATAQIQDCALAANINHILRQGILAIWPQGGFRNFPAPLISPKTGLIGYPSFASNGVAIRTIFNPGLVIGYPIQVESSIVQACGTWNAFQVSHTLESQMPGGLWESQIYAQRPGQQPTQ